MSYFIEDPSRRLTPYADAGMGKKTLAYGYNYGNTYNIPQEVEWLKSNGYGGVMIFAFQNSNNRDLMGQVINAWYGPGNWNYNSNE